MLGSCHHSLERHPVLRPILQRMAVSLDL